MSSDPRTQQHWFVNHLRFTDHKIQPYLGRVTSLGTVGNFATLALFAYDGLRIVLQCAAFQCSKYEVAQVQNIACFLNFLVRVSLQNGNYSQLLWKCNHFPVWSRPKRCDLHRRKLATFETTMVKMWRGWWYPCIMLSAVKVVDAHFCGHSKAILYHNSFSKKKTTGSWVWQICFSLFEGLFLN